MRSNNVFKEKNQFRMKIQLSGKGYGIERQRNLDLNRIITPTASHHILNYLSTSSADPIVNKLSLFYEDDVQRHQNQWHKYTKLQNDFVFSRQIR